MGGGAVDSASAWACSFCCLSFNFAKSSSLAVSGSGCFFGGLHFTGGGLGLGGSELFFLGDAGLE